MFEALTERLTGIFGRLSSRGRLTESDVDAALKEVRIALLEADVNFRVARDLIARVRERVVGTEALTGINPSAQVVKAVNDELTATLSGGEHKLHPASQPPTVVALVGLQGSGKTTTAAKLALHLRRSSGASPLLVAADLRRPAAVEQLVSLGRQMDLPVYTEPSTSPAQVAAGGVARARETDASWVVVDTGGRLHVEDELMEELEELRSAVGPHETLLVVDAMTGQDAVQAAEAFQQRAGVTGIVLTKMDGDARGGAALSITAVTGVPVKFIGTGERPDALEAFHPDRLASRILGMGDVLSLVERAQSVVDQQQAQEMEKKLRRATFDLQDFLEQLRAVQRMGPISQVLEMLPGASQLRGQLSADGLEGKKMQRVEAIVLSMTPQERRTPAILNASRRRRIARGSGTTVQELNQMLNQFQQMQKLMKQMSRSKGRGMRNPLRF